MSTILEARAQKLSRVLEKKEDKTGSLQLLSFALNDEQWGVELHWIEEVYQIREPTELPLAPSFLYGVINVRQKVVPVFNLKAFFDFPKHVPHSKNRAIILTDGQTRFGILADEILGIETINEKKIQPLPSGLTGIREEILLGITYEGLAVADGKKLLANPRLIIKG